MSFTRTIVITGVLTLVGCNSASKQEVPPVESQAVEVRQFAELAGFQYNSGIDTAERRAIRDARAWTDLWARITANASPSVPAPPVDFTKDMVLFASLGTRGSGGYSIAIDKVVESNGKLEVIVRETSPGPNCAATMAITAPVTAVRIPRRDIEPVFSVRSDTTPC
jgi:protease stability complex PrcB-like protein